MESTPRTQGLPTNSAQLLRLRYAHHPGSVAELRIGFKLVRLSKWVKQDDLVRSARPDAPSSKSTELHAARRRVREPAVERQSATFLAEVKPRPKGCSWLSTDSSTPGLR